MLKNLLLEEYFLINKVRNGFSLNRIPPLNMPNGTFVTNKAYCRAIIISRTLLFNSNPIHPNKQNLRNAFLATLGIHNTPRKPKSSPSYSKTHHVILKS